MQLQQHLRYTQRNKLRLPSSNDPFKVIDGRRLTINCLVTGFSDARKLWICDQMGSNSCKKNNSNIYRSQYLLLQNVARKCIQCHFLFYFKSMRRLFLFLLSPWAIPFATQMKFFQRQFENYDSFGSKYFATIYSSRVITRHFQNILLLLV